MKKGITIFILLLAVISLSGCIPPFYDGGIVAEDYFEEDVRYTTFGLAAGEPSGFVESAEGTQSLKDYIDEDETNIPMRQYRKVSLTTKAEGIMLTAFAFIVEAEEDCFVSLSLYYGGIFIASERLFVSQYGIETAYFSELSITLLTAEKLSIIITNPLEIGAIAFRTDTYIFIGEEV